MRHESDYAVQNRGPPLLREKLGGEGYRIAFPSLLEEIGGERKLIRLQQLVRPDC
jgi:hypothetical protein